MRGGLSERVDERRGKDGEKVSCARERVFPNRLMEIRTMGEY